MKRAANTAGIELERINTVGSSSITSGERDQEQSVSRTSSFYRDVDIQPRSSCLGHDRLSIRSFLHTIAQVFF